MSKLAIDKVFICGLKKDGKKILDLLQVAGVCQVEEQEISKEGLSIAEVSKEKTKFEKYVKLCDDTINIINQYKKDDSVTFLSSFEEAKNISKEEYFSRVAYVKDSLKVANRIYELSKEISEQKALIPKLESKIEQLKIWENLDIPLNLEGTKNTKIFIGSLKNEISQDDLYKLILEGMTDDCSKYIDINIVGQNKEMTCILVVTLNQFKDIVEDRLKKLDFQRSPFSKTIPKEEIKNIKDNILDVQRKIKEAETEIAEYAKYRDDLKFASDYYSLRKEKYEVISKVPTTERAYFVSGYVLRKYSQKLLEKINNEVDAYVEIVEPGEDEDVPVALQNGFFAGPMEAVVESYSLPTANEIDPSKVLSLFYYLLFGLMLSDAGYGLMLVLGTGILLLKVKNMKPDLKKMMKLFFYGGISTIIWGILFGSFFGDSVDVICQKYLHVVPEGTPVLVPFLQKLHLYWFDPVSLPMKLLMFAFGLGIIHLITGLCLKGYMLLKQGAIKDFIYDFLFWFLFVVGCIGSALGLDMVTSMIGEGFALPQPILNISHIMAVIGCVGVIFTGGRESRNWFKRLLKGAYAVYGITGWLSDILSYSRLLALGLATGIIAQVFNKMGSMIEVPFLGLIIFIIVFVVGHVLNLGINVLGAYVHTNRLQYVEFFGKFYEGGGKKFQPFKENTKYYLIKEEK